MDTKAFCLCGRRCRVKAVAARAPALFAVPVRRRLAAFVAAVLAFTAVATSSAHAQVTWTGSSGLWNASNAWSTSLGAGTSFSSGLVFAGNTLTSSTNNYTSGTATSITFNSTAGAFTISGSTFTLTGNVANNSGNTQTIQNNIALAGNSTFSGTAITLAGMLTNSGGDRILTSSLASGQLLTLGSINLSENNTARTFTLAGTGNTTITGSIGNGGTGAGGLTISNSGTTSLSVANTYSGTTTLNNGTLRLLDASSLQNSTLALSGTGAVSFDSSVAGNAFTIGGLSASNAAATLALANSAASPITLTVGGNNATTTYSGTLTGGGTLVKAGSGQLTLGGINTYSGRTQITSGTLAISSDANLGAVPGTADATNLTLSGGGVLALTASATTSANRGLSLSGAGGSISAAASTASAYQGIIAGSGNFTKLGTGTLALSGANTYTGTTTLSAGVVEAGSASALGSGGNITFSGATLRYTAASAGTDFGSRIKNSQSAISINPNGQTISLSGIDSSNTAGLTVPLGVSGTLALPGSNSYSGTTSLNTNSTVLLVGHNNAFGQSVVNLNSNPGTGLQASTDVVLPNTFLFSNAFGIGGSNNITMSGVGYIPSGGRILNQFSSASGKSLTLSGTLFLQSSGGTSTSGTGILAGPGNTLISGVIRDSDTAPASSVLSITSTGTVTLTGSNSYSGGTELAGNTQSVVIGNANALGTGPISFNIGTANLRGSSSLTLANNLVNTAGNRTFGSNFDAGTTLTINGTTFLQESGTGVGRTFTVSGSGNTTFAGPIVNGGTAGNSSLTISNTGTTTLAAANTYTGSTTLSGAGTVVLGNNSSFGGSGGTPGPVTISAAATLQASAALSNVANSFTLTGDPTVSGANSITLSGPITNSGGNRQLTSSITSGSLTITGTTFLQESGTGVGRTMTIAGSGNTVFSGPIVNGGTAGNSNLTITNTGVTTLSAANTYTGTTTASAGVLRFDAANALPGGIGSTGGSSALTINGGVIGLGNGDFTRGLGTGVTQVQITGGGFAAYGANRIVNLGGASGTATWGSGNFITTGSAFVLGATDATHTVDFQNPIALGSAVRTVRVDNGSADVDAKLGGVVSGVTAGNGLTKTGAGTLDLSAANSFTGTLAVQNGTVRFTSLAAGSGAQNLGAGTLVNLGVASTSSGELNYLGSGGTLDKNITALGNGRNRIRNSGAGTLILSGTLTKDGTILELAGGTFNVSGRITGATVGTSDLFVNGAAVTLSSTNNDYNGPTYVYGGGSITLGASGVIPNNSPLLLGGTGSDTGIGTINTGTFTDTIASLTSSSLGSTIGITINGATAGGLTMGNLTFGAGTDTLALSLTGPSAVRYTLLTYTGALSGTFDSVTGNGNYSVVYGNATNGTIDLQLKANQSSTFTLNSAAGRVLVGGSTQLSGLLANSSPTGAAALAWNPASAGTLTASGFTSSLGSTIASGSTSSITAWLSAGNTAGTQNWSIANTDNNAITTVSTATGSIDVVNVRTFTVNSPTIDLGRFLKSGSAAGSTSITSTGLFATTESGTIGSFSNVGGSNGLTLTLGTGSAQFVGAISPQTTGYNLGGIFSGAAGAISGTFSTTASREFSTAQSLSVAYTGNALDARTYSVANSGTVSLGRFLITGAASGSTTISSSGLYASTESGSIGSFSNVGGSNGLSLSLAGGSSNVFDGLTSPQNVGYLVGGTYSGAAGAVSGIFTATATNELSGTSGVNVAYTGNAVNQRSFSVSNSGTINLGNFLRTGSVTGSTTILSTGLNDTTANATLGSFSGTSTNGFSLATLDSTIFNGGTSSQSALYTLSGSAASAGAFNGSFSSEVTAELGTIDPVTVSLVGTAYDPAIASFTTLSATTSWLVDIGSFNQNTGTHQLGFSIFNLVTDPTYTADLRLLSITDIGTPSGSLSIDLTPALFGDLLAGGTSNWLASLSSLTTGSFSNQYQLNFVSAKNGQSLGGPQSMTLTVTGIIVVPEPGALALAGIGIAAAYAYRRRRS